MPYTKKNKSVGGKATRKAKRATKKAGRKAKRAGRKM